MGYVIFAFVLIAFAIAGPSMMRKSAMTDRSARLAQIVAVALCFLSLMSTSYYRVPKSEVAHFNRLYLGDTLSDGRLIATGGEMGMQADIVAEGFHISPLVNVMFDVEMLDVVEIPEGFYGELTAKDGNGLRPDQAFAEAFPVGERQHMVEDARYFLGADLANDQRVRAPRGRKGPQVSVLPPGRHRLNRYLWDVEVRIPQGSLLLSKWPKQDGKPINFPDYYRVVAKESESTEVTEIPVGFVGVIRSNVKTGVDFGEFGVPSEPDSCEPTATKDPTGGKLAVPLVPVGCIGIWDQSLSPGKYFINRRAFALYPVDTRLQTWEYRGGYTKRRIDLDAEEDGRIVARETENQVPVPSDAAGSAVFIKVEGWEVPQEARAQVQVSPAEAPFVIASVGGLTEVRDRIITPAMRSVLRNIGGGQITALDVLPVERCNDRDREGESYFIPTTAVGVPTGAERTQIQAVETEEDTTRDEQGDDGQDTESDAAAVQEIEVVRCKVTRPTRVLDLMENRTVLEGNIEEKIKPEGDKAGVDVKEVRLGEPAIPPELLVARRREQLAQQLEAAFAQEKRAQDKRVETARARATADQQPNLVKAEIEVQRAERLKKARQLEGEGERLKLSEIAAGQRAQAAVLGQDRVAELRKFEFVVGRLLEIVEKNPELIESAMANANKLVPNIVVGDGDANSLGALGAILGPTLSGQYSNEKAARQSAAQP